MSIKTVTRGKAGKKTGAGGKKPRTADAKPRPEKKDGKQDERAKVGTRLLTDAEIARLTSQASDGNPLTMALARFRLYTDRTRRHAQAGQAGRKKGPRSHEAVRITDSGVTGPGGGRERAVAAPVEFRATTAQAAGLWPWCVGAGVPILGTPLGEHLHTGEPVCFDPLNWFARGHLLTAPSLFILGLNGFGKSSLMRRLIIGGVAQGVMPLILADVKPDYRDTIEGVGGQVIDVGYGFGTINPIDPGVMGIALQQLRDHDMDEQADALAAELRARQTNLVAALVELVRGRKIEDFEDTLISSALRILFTPEADGGRGYTVDAPPILEDLDTVLAVGGPDLMLDAVAATPEDYQAATIGLRRSLRALTQGPFGRVFNGPTSTPIDIDSVGVCVDVSHIPKSDKKLKAAVMLTTWSAGFGAVEANNLLAEVGLKAQRYYRVVMDELWQVLGLGAFMVDRVDELTRLQRSIGVEVDMISHSIRDLQGLSGDASDRALGFLERARAKILGPLPAQEIAALSGIVKLTAAETAMVTGWSAPQTLVGELILTTGAERPPAPGVGKFLLIIGEADGNPGIPFRLVLTRREISSGIHDTSKLFAQFGQPAAALDGAA